MSDLTRILVLEDDVSMRTILEQVLRSRGYEVVVSSRGEEAVHRASGENFDLIVADIRMEGMSGLDAIEKAQEMQPDIGSIVVSGFASEEETLRAVKLNVEGYLKKPFQIDALLELIDSHLAKRQEKRRRNQELSHYRRSLYWSLAEQSNLVGKLQNRSVAPLGELARQLAIEAGFGGNLPDDIHLGALLLQMRELQDREWPEHLKSVLEGSHLVTSCLEQRDIPEVIRLARFVNQHRGEEGEDWPVLADDSEWEPRLLEAYQRLSNEESRKTAEPKSVAGLLGLGLMLEHAGEWEAASKAYAEVTQHQAISPESVLANLGLARVAGSQGKTKKLEISVKNALDAASKIGPVNHAEAELQSAQLLFKTQHPSAQKLLRRAVNSCTNVGLDFLAARATLSLCLMPTFEDESQLLPAVNALLIPEHRWQLLESTHDILPELLQVCCSSSLATCRDRIEVLVFEHPGEIVDCLNSGLMSDTAKQGLLNLCIASKRAVPSSFHACLSQDPVPEIREQAQQLKVAEGSGAPAGLLRIYSLGPLQVNRNGKFLDLKELKTEKTRFLLAQLCGSGARAVSVERLMEDYWSNLGAKARNNLNTSVSLIRRFLVEPNSELDPLTRVGESVRLNPELRIWHDVDELDKAAEAATTAMSRGNIQTALPLLRRVVKLYRAPFLEDCYMDWALQRRTRLEVAVVDALRTLTDHLFEQKRYSEMLEYALRLLTFLPDDIETHDRVLKSYIALEQTEKALEHFQNYEKKLADDDLEPDMTLVRTYQMAKYGINSEAAPGL